MSQINIRNLSNENNDGSPEIVGVSTFSATSFFVPPKGTTAERPSDCEPGSIRFNTDTANLEYFRGKTIGWSQFELINPNLGGGTGSNTGVGARGLFVGGYSPSHTATIEFITISTFGNSQDFGDLGNNYSAGAATNDRTRGWYSGGNVPNNIDDMLYVTLSSGGMNSIDSGYSLVAVTKGHPTGCSSSTRGVIMGGRNSSGAEINVIQYHTIQTLGNASDFGDLTAPRGYNGGNCNSSTRGLSIGGYSPVAPTRVNTIEFVTIATTGNSADFGDVSYVHNSSGSASNSTRGIIAGGRTPGDVNSIEFVTIATLGNTTDFGDLIGEVNGDVGCCSSPTRCVIGGGGTGGTPGGAQMNSVEIATTGNALDFGDLTVADDALQEPGMWSTGHGGL